jgi:penicillin amidase
VSERRTRRRLWFALCVLAASGCGPLELLRYAVLPDPPELRGGEEIALAGLAAPVEVARRPDGLWRIEAASERDALVAQGYLLARDRLAQLDLFRHLARGELAAWLGLRAFGDRTTLDVDRLNRFLGFSDTAERLLAATSPAERDLLAAFAAGIDAWIAEGRPSLEHRLLGVETVAPWTPLDSLAIYAMVMHGLSSNADREIRRLAIACAAGLDALERIWPTDLEFDSAALPEEAWDARSHPPVPAVAPELVAELPALCAAGTPPLAGAGDARAAARGAAGVRFAGPLDPLRALAGFSASNNWTVSGAHTASGRPVFASDPHLPHMNPPLVWGVELLWPGAHRAGFALAGTQRLALGHNGRVAFGPTTNHVDRQDLVVHRPRSEQRGGRRIDGYELEGAFVPFEVREELFEVRGGAPVRLRARFTRDGPVLADLELLPAGLPLVALRVVPVEAPSDLDGAAASNAARSAAEFAAGISRLDLGCSSWLFADADGHLGFRSPCRVPVRDGWRGTFPVPGWRERYAWRGVLAKDALPAVDDPARGWLATANSQLVPSRRFPTAYNNDAASPSRFLRISARLAEARAGGGLTAEGSAAIQLDHRWSPWSALRPQLDGDLCAPRARAEEPALAAARAALCRWDGAMSADSPVPTLHTLWTHALLDRALADELPGGAGGELWRFVQALLHFEAVADHLWTLPADAAAWDDVRTPERETRAELFERALVDALAEARRRWGGGLEDWTWGRVRPFPLRHPFAPRDGPGLGWLLNARPAPADGGTETVWKQQFVRADRGEMHPAVGPVVRMSLDLADPWAAAFALAGGESGWPRSRFYGNLLEDWRRGRTRPLTPPPSEADVRARLVPPDPG